MGGLTSMYQVVKRDNSIVAFNLQKITAAIKKAFDACKREYTDDIIEFSTKNCKTNIVIQAIRSLEVDETEEIARVKAKTENGTFVKFTYKNL